MKTSRLRRRNGRLARVIRRYPEEYPMQSRCCPRFVSVMPVMTLCCLRRCRFSDRKRGRSRCTILPTDCSHRHELPAAEGAEVRVLKLQPIDPDAVFITFDMVLDQPGLLAISGSGNHQQCGCADINTDIRGGSVPLVASHTALERSAQPPQLKALSCKGAAGYDQGRR